MDTSTVRSSQAFGARTRTGYKLAKHDLESTIGRHYEGWGSGTVYRKRNSWSLISGVRLTFRVGIRFDVHFGGGM